MATFLDLGLAQHFSSIFPVLLVFVIVFALLEKSKVLGGNKGLDSLIALCIGIMMLFVPGVVDIIKIMTPWFVLLFLLVFFFIVWLLAFGTKLDSITKYASDWGTAHWFFLIISLVIAIGAIASVYGSAMLPYSQTGETGSQETSTNGTATVGLDGTATDTGDFNKNVGRVIFHPKTIGLVFLLMVGSLTIKLMSSSSK
jgi:hypothetical protein